MTQRECAYRPSREARSSISARIALPSAGNEGFALAVRGDAGDHVESHGLHAVILPHEAGDVLLVARGREGAGDPDEDDLDGLGSSHGWALSCAVRLAFGEAIGRPRCNICTITFFPRNSSSAVASLGDEGSTKKVTPPGSESPTPIIVKIPLAAW